MEFRYGYGRKTKAFDNFTYLEVPIKCPLWETGLIRPEVPMFNYAFSPKCKLLCHVIEFLEPRMVTIDNIPVMLYGNNTTTPHCKIANITQKFLHIIPMDYADGMITYPPPIFGADLGTTVKGSVYRASIMHSEISGKFPATGSVIGAEWHRDMGAQTTRHMVRVRKTFTPAWLSHTGHLPTTYDLKTNDFSSRQFLNPDDRYLQYKGFNKEPNVYDGSCGICDTFPTKLPFVSDQKMRPQYFKAEALWHWPNRLPNHIFFTVYLEFEILVYKVNLEGFKKITGDTPAGSMPHISLNTRAYGLAPIHCVAENHKLVKIGTTDMFAFSNSYNKVYVPTVQLLPTGPAVQSISKSLPVHGWYDSNQFRRGRR